MTLDQTQFRSTRTNALQTAADPADVAGPQVWEDMTVEVALSVMAAARTGHLVVCDEDGVGTGLVTRDRLTAVRDGSAYTDRIRLRDIADVIGPFASPPATRAEAERAMRRRLGAPPVVDGHGNALGVVALCRITRQDRRDFGTGEGVSRTEQ
ncbi:CBS domain-containing protein [Streptomyces sp900105245]|uniref:CBS domain-containing protein n=1 Tax=Streptomyces sp. 900105245 TaxID=3154379 RepID=A0ABV1UFT9_9ACTN